MIWMRKADLYIFDRRWIVRYGSQHGDVSISLGITSQVHQVTTTQAPFAKFSLVEAAR